MAALNNYTNSTNITSNHFSIKISKSSKRSELKYVLYTFILQSSWIRKHQKSLNERNPRWTKLILDIQNDPLLLTLKSLLRKQKTPSTALLQQFYYYFQITLDSKHINFSQLNFYNQ